MRILRKELTPEQEAERQEMAAVLQVQKRMAQRRQAKEAMLLSSPHSEPKAATNLKAIKSKITALIEEVRNEDTQNADGRAEAAAASGSHVASTQAVVGAREAGRGESSTESKADTGGQPTAAANTRTETEVTFNVGKDFKQFKFAKYVDPKKPRAAPVRRDPNEPKRCASIFR